MIQRARNIVPFLILTILLAGCASGITQPENSILPRDPSSRSNSHLLGEWTLQFDPESQTVSIIPIRRAGIHIDVTSMLQGPDCQDCLTIEVIGFDPGEHAIEILLTLTHDFQVTGYDVRCIIFTNDLGHLLINPDDWTSLFDIPGGKDINPFRTFAKDESGHIFRPGSLHAETFIIQTPSPPMYGAIRFAIEASWPGNCSEPYEIYGFEQGTIYGIADSTGALSVYALDWQDDVSALYLSAQEITGEELVPFNYDSDNRWELELVNETGVPGGTYEATIIAASENSGNTYLYDVVEIVLTEWTADLDLLFAPPTPDEIAAVFADWESRDLSPLGVIIEGEAEYPDGATLIVLSHLVSGERHYAALRIPPGAHDPGSVAILMLLHGGHNGTGDEAFFTSGTAGDNFIQIIPSFRGEKLTIQDGPLAGVYQSEGESNGWDTDADDTIALLSVVLENVGEADDSRIAAMGGSRGGGTTLRSRVRDDRFVGVIDFFGAADFYTDDLRAAAELHLHYPQFMGNNPLESGIIKTLIIPLSKGELTMLEAKHTMLLASPAWFAHLMPRLQVHHGTEDDVVPVNQSDRIAEEMDILGIEFPDFEYFRYDGGTHNIGSLEGSDVSVNKFLQWILNPDG